MKTKEEMIEMIETIEAFTEGKKIECRFRDCKEWEDDTAPQWNWVLFDYRVKPDVHYRVKFRPYKDTEEMLNDFCKRFHVKRTDFGEPFIWIRPKEDANSKYLISSIEQYHVGYDDKFRWCMADLLNKFTYKDGTPCGKKV